MAIQFEQVFIPLASGLGQSFDERVLPVGKLLECHNGYFDKTGALTQRKGFSKMTVVTAVGGNLPDARQIFSTGDELCVLGNNRLFAYNTAHARWYDRGYVSPFTGRLSPVHRDEYTYPQSDMDEDATGKYLMYAAQRQRRVDPDTVSASYEYALMLSVRGEDGGVLITPTEYVASVAAATKVHGVRASHCTGKLLAFGMRGQAAPADIDVWEYATATPQTAPTGPTTLTAAAFQGLDNVRTYDVTHMATGEYCLAYVENTNQDIVLDVNNAAHVTQHTLTISDNRVYERVAVNLSPTTGNIYVATYTDAAVGADRVDLYCYDDSLTLQWGPINLDSPSATKTVQNIGVCESNARVVVVWTVVDTGPEHETHSRSTNLSGAALDTESVTYNCYARSRPFNHDLRTFCVCSSSLGDTEFEVSVVLDLNVNETGGRAGTHETVGVFDVGVGPSVNTVQVKDVEANNFGSCNTVVTTATGEYRTMSISQRWHQTDALACKYASDELTLEFNLAPQVATVTRGCAMVGGGKVSWYAGDVAEEVGFVSAPVIRSATGIALTVPGYAPGNLVTGSTYRYQAVWQFYDIKGNLHRSAPCAYVEGAIDAGPPIEKAVQLNIRTMPFSRRFGETDRGAAAVVYRNASGDGAVYKQCSPPIYMPLNSNSAIDITWYDDGSLFDAGPPEVTGGTAIYIASGEIEAVQPEGARLISVASERVWLADFYRRDRIQYSKRYAPGTATEVSVAPEFNEGFGLMVPSGERVTGLVELDDNMVVLTPNEIYIIGGSGPDDNGAGNDFSGLRKVASDSGTSEPRSVVAYPGGVMFLSHGSFYNLNRGHSLEIMDDVDDILESYPTVTSAVLVPGQQHIRFTAVDAAGTSGVIIIFDYRVRAWMYWSPTTVAGAKAPLVSACVHDGVYYGIQADGTIWYEDSASSFDDSTKFIPFQVECAWLQRGQQGGWQRARYASALLKYLGPHQLKFSIFNDFETAASQEVTYTEAQVLAFAATPREQPMVHITRQQCQAVKFRVESLESAGAATAEGFSIAGFTCTFGVKPGRVRVGTNQRN